MILQHVVGELKVSNIPGSRDWGVFRATKISKDGKRVVRSQIIYRNSLAACNAYIQQIKERR